MVVGGVSDSSTLRHEYSMCGMSNLAAVLETMPRVCGLPGPKIADTPSVTRSQAIEHKKSIVK